MKKQILFLSAVALLAFSTSCNKDSDSPTPNPPTNPNVPDPANPDPTQSGPTPATPVISGAYGTLISVIMKYSVTNEFLPDPIVVESQVGIAAFPAANSTDFLPAGTVSVNGYDLEKADNNSYYVTATAGMTPSTLEFSGSSEWSVSGAGSIAAFTYDHIISFPNFTGSLPSSITKSNGVTVSLDGSVNGADSVYLVVTAGDQYIQTAVGGNASSISLSAAELQNLPVVSDNTAFLQIVPFRVTLETLNSNQYAFVKQQAVVTAVNIQ